MDYLLLHCSKTRVLWELLFSLFGFNWIISRKVLLLEREERKFGEQLLLACFGQCGRLEIELSSRKMFCLYRN